MANKTINNLRDLDLEKVSFGAATKSKSGDAFIIPIKYDSADMYAFTSAMSASKGINHNKFKPDNKQVFALLSDDTTEALDKLFSKFETLLSDVFTTTGNATFKSPLLKPFKNDKTFFTYLKLRATIFSREDGAFMKYDELIDHRMKFVPLLRFSHIYVKDGTAYLQWWLSSALVTFVEREASIMHQSLLSALKQAEQVIVPQQEESASENYQQMLEDGISQVPMP
jgi:hypothetical protein